MKNLLLIALLGLAAFNGYTFYKTGNIPLRDWGQQVARDGLTATWQNFSFSRVISQVKQNANALAGEEVVAPGPTKIQISKWTDAQGVVHYDNKPVKGAASITINPNANVLPMEDAQAPAAAEAPPMTLQQEMLENREKMQRAAEARLGI